MANSWTSIMMHKRPPKGKVFRCVFSYLNVVCCCGDVAQQLRNGCWLAKLSLLSLQLSASSVFRSMLSSPPQLTPDLVRISLPVSLVRLIVFRCFSVLRRLDYPNGPFTSDGTNAEWPYRPVFARSAEASPERRGNLSFVSPFHTFPPPLPALVISKHKNEHY